MATPVSSEAPWAVADVGSVAVGSGEVHRVARTGASIEMLSGDGEARSLPPLMASAIFLGGRGQFQMNRSRS